MDEPFIPTVENPGRVSFSEDGTSWSCTRDEFIIHRDENGKETYVLQALVTLFRPAGSPLPPQTTYVEGPFPSLTEEDLWKSV